MINKSIEQLLAKKAIKEQREKERLSRLAGLEAMKENK